MSFDSIVDVLNQNNQLTDIKRLKAAFDFASLAHAGQVRQTGDLYITHPIQVALILASWGQSQAVIEAALLHDTVEDNPTVSLDQITKQFGPEVAHLVDGVTKVGQVKLRGSKELTFVENLRKMFVAMAQDIRVILIRLADRLHNMQTLDAVPLAKQKRIAAETLEIYAPLAERLGMGAVKGQLEDLSFLYVHPKEYDWLHRTAGPHFQQAEEVTTQAIEDLTKALNEAGIQANVHGRHKHKYSLFKKLTRPEINHDLTLIHDLVALRVITKNTMDCYAALGLVHQLWRPVPLLGVSDFIASPKPNGYRSIHTKVFDSKGHIIEVQIRTEEMHHQAEYGAAAHFAYSEAKTQGAENEKLEKGTAFTLTNKMAWVNQLAAWQQEVSDSEEYVTSLKLDALSSRIYVFSPSGDVYDLPQEATPIDYAFAVHTDLGSYLTGARVNGKIVPLNFKLKSGDVVEIIKSKQPKAPSRDWLKYVKTQKARSRINHHLKVVPSL